MRIAWRDAFLVDHRQHARHRGIDQRDVAVGRAAEFGRGAGEQLRLGGDLGMHLHADDDFPVAGRAFDQFAGLRSASRHAASRSSASSRRRSARQARTSKLQCAPKRLFARRRATVDELAGTSISRPSRRRRILATRTRRNARGRALLRQLDVRHQSRARQSHDHANSGVVAFERARPARSRPWPPAPRRSPFARARRSATPRPAA